MDSPLWETPEEIIKELALREKRLRKRKGITQEELSRRCGVSYGSLKRFEATGNISLASLTRIAMELGCQDQIKQMFANVAYASIQEVINEGR